MSLFLNPPPLTVDNVLNAWLSQAYEQISRLSRFVTGEISVTTTLSGQDSGLWIIKNTAAITINLPSSSAVGKGFWLLFIKSTAAAFAATLDGYSTETINGSATNIEMDAQYDRLGVVADSSNFLIFERFIS